MIIILFVLQLKRKIWKNKNNIFNESNENSESDVYDESECDENFMNYYLYLNINIKVFVGFKFIS